jgi:nucleoid DNA-binding protein
MDKYIIELLDTNTRVIIPDFGAFIIKQKEPRLIVFNEFLRYNDGLLIEYLAKSEGIEKDAAKKKVNEYVEKATNNLKDNNEHSIAGLGILRKESTGKVTFEEISGTAKKDARKKAPPKTAEEDKKAKEEEEKKAKAEEEKKAKTEEEKKAKEAAKAAPAPTAIKVEKAPEEEKKAQPAEQKKEKPAEEKPAATRIVAPPSKEQEKKDIIPPKRTEPAAGPVMERRVETKRRKKSNSQIIIWIILILVINAAIISWFVFNDEIRGFINKQTKDSPGAEDESVIKIGSLEEESEEVTKGEVKPEEEGIEVTVTEMEREEIIEPETAPEIEEEAISYSEKRYYIVAGCFRDENNADGLVRKLTRQGFDAEKFGKIGNLHAVSFASFIDKSEAQVKLREVRQQEPDAWLIYY